MPKHTLNMLFVDADLMTQGLNAYDQTSLNHPELRFLSSEIKEALDQKAAEIFKDVKSFNRFTAELKTPEIEEFYMAISRVISKKIEEILHEPPDEYGSPLREMEALLRYRNVIFEWFKKEYGIFQEQLQPKN